MDPKLLETFRRLAGKGLPPEKEKRMLAELAAGGDHSLQERPARKGGLRCVESLYAWGDLAALQALSAGQGPYVTRIRSLEELLERDRLREEDGFPRKIRVGRLLKPGQVGNDKVVIVPTTVEEKLLHDTAVRPEEEGASGGGSGEGEEGEVIGEQPVREADGPGTGGAGQGEGGMHEVESSAYDLGRILTEKFALPNLKEKGKKRSLARYTYELTDKNRGFGQILDKKATLRSILETNLGLGNIPDVAAIDPTRLVVGPDDKVFRILSREKELESQAMVFFLRDYSGSMAGKATELVVSQHVLIYSWLLYQYERQVETRFILHDTDAREVPDFYTYYNSRVAGGTQVASAYRMVNEIVETEGLARDYNIYVFHGTDGDDWDQEGRETLPALEKMLGYASRVGITIAEHLYGDGGRTEVERYLRNSGLLESRGDYLRLDSLGEDAEEPRIIEGIRVLIS